MSSSSPYRPTPLERAQSIHLLLTYFNTAVDFNDDAAMRVSGRDAVPFLTSVSSAFIYDGDYALILTCEINIVTFFLFEQSGVDRSLLRSIWSVADPEGVGTLTTR